MAIRKIWVVVKLPNIHTGRGDADNAVSINNRGRGNLNRDDYIKNFHTVEAEATAECDRLAAESPMTPYAVMAITDIRETATPTIIRKQFTSEGELTLA